jgi:hypothetical protein
MGRLRLRLLTLSLSHFSGPITQSGYTFSICKPISAACPNTWPESPMSACPKPNSAYMCSVTPNSQDPSNPFQRCAGSTAAPPQYYGCGQEPLASCGPSTVSTDYGVIVSYTQGDFCEYCNPFMYSTDVAIVCDATKVPQVVSIANPSAVRRHENRI